jgi:hypothetical protein
MLVGLIVYIMLINDSMLLKNLYNERYVHKL